MWDDAMTVLKNWCYEQAYERYKAMGLFDKPNILMKIPKSRFTEPPTSDDSFMIKVKASEIDWSTVYRPYVPLQIIQIDDDYYIPKRESTAVVVKMFGGGGGGGRVIDTSKYPHKCPRCSAPAYIGFVNVDCSNGDCT